MKHFCRIVTATIIVLSLFSFIRLDSIDIESVQANGSVTVDGESTSKAFNRDYDEVVTLPHTTGIGENRMLLVAISWGRDSTGTVNRTILDITYNEVPLELVVEASQDPYNNVAIYRYPDEAPYQLTADVDIEFTSANKNVVVGAINFAGVDLSNPFGELKEATGYDASNIIVSIPTQNGEMVFDTISTESLELIANEGQTEHWNKIEESGVDQLGAASTQTASSTITSISWLGLYNYDWAMAAVAIKPLQTTIPGIGDYVWIDQNGDGIQNDGEPGLPDVVVDLFQEGGSNPILTTGTDSEGHYFFDNPLDGDYYLKFSHPTIDLEFTLQGQGSDEKVDSDVDANGLTNTFTYKAGTTNQNVDAGVIMPDNPPLTATCGLDIALVIDSSLTTEGNLDNVKTAIQDFTSTILPATPTQIALLDYDTIAKVWDFDNDQWDDIATAEDGMYWSNDLAAINSAIGSVQNDGSTNYGDALSDVQALFAFDRDENPDLIIFSTHSHPDSIGPEGSAAGATEAMAVAIQKAFLIKSDEIRILSMGIGTEFDPTNLIAISGSKIDTSPVKDADVITSDFVELSNKLDSLAKDMCGGTCTIHNVIDQDANLETRDDWITEGDAVKDWEFIISNLESGISLSDGQVNPVMTEMDGQSTINFIVTSSPATFNLQETTPDGWELLDVECFSNGTPLSAIEVTETLVSGISFTDNNDILSCYFYNHPTPSAVTLLSFTAKFEGDSVLLEWETASEIDNLGFNLYREEAQSGVREKINPQLIPSKLPGSIEGALYDFYDDNVNFGEPDAYWLEAIDLSMRVKDSYGPVNVIWWQFFLPIFSVGN